MNPIYSMHIGQPKSKMSDSWNSIGFKSFPQPIHLHEGHATFSSSNSPKINPAILFFLERLEN